MKLKKALYCLCLLFNSLYGFAQSDLSVYTKGDTTAFNKLLDQSIELLFKDPQKALVVAIEAKELAEKINFFKGQAYALKNIGIAYYNKGEYGDALGYWRESLNIFEKISEEKGIANMLNNISAIYIMTGDDKKALDYSLRSLKIAEKTNDKLRILTALNNIGGVYFEKPATHDKALTYFLKALPLSEELGDTYAIGTTSVNLGEIYYVKNQDSLALHYYFKSIKAFNNSEGSPYSYNAIGKLYNRKENYGLAISYHNKALAIAEKLNGSLDIVQSLMGLTKTNISKKDFTEALIYLKKAKKIAFKHNFSGELKSVYESFSNVYNLLNDYKNAYVYQSKYSAIKDTLYNIETDNKLGSLQFDLDMQKRDDSILLVKNVELQELRFEKFTSQYEFKNYILVGGIVTLMIVAIFLYYNNRQKQRAKTKVEQAYTELKSTQSQLIQSEKMASLGELTAGIAHEIQNPLNFVNNFSEVSTELVDEMNEEIDKGNLQDAKEIANDLKQNLEKINHHGKRAGDIVKGMLQHSRSTNNATKEPTDINKLADEYLRLAYHGLRAKDKSFNSTMKTDFDETIGNINIIPQDMGRVILNLITNAFYVVDEKKKSGIENYEPTVTVSTKKLENKVEIKVADNGNGMPKKVLDKIFQPFFTTKPTGQGTGLGLSLSYDIVKANNGELKVETKEGEGTIFSVILPS